MKHRICKNSFRCRSVVVCLLIVLFLVGCEKNIQQQITEQLELGYRYLEEEQYEEAVTVFEKVIGIDPEQASAYLGEATAYASMEDYPNAVNILEMGYEKVEGAELEGRLAEICQEAAQYHYDRGEYDSTEEYLQRIPEAHQDTQFNALKQELEMQKASENIPEASVKEAAPENEDIDIPEETELPEEEEQSASYDLKDYANIFPEDMGGNLAETLASLLYPENPSFSESDDGMMYVLGDYDMEVGASGNNDGYMVWQYRPIEGFRIYGIEPGMSEADAQEKLESQGIYPENGYYMIPKDESETSNGYKYIWLIAENGVVAQVRFMRYLGQEFWEN